MFHSLDLTTLLLGVAAAAGAIYSIKVARWAIFIVRIVGSLGLVRGLTATSLIGLAFAGVGTTYNYVSFHNTVEKGIETASKTHNPNEAKSALTAAIDYMQKGHADLLPVHLCAASVDKDEAADTFTSNLEKAHDELNYKTMKNSTSFMEWQKKFTDTFTTPNGRGRKVEYPEGLQFGKNVMDYLLIGATCLLGLAGAGSLAKSHNSKEVAVAADRSEVSNLLSRRCSDLDRRAYALTEKENLIAAKEAQTVKALQEAEDLKAKAAAELQAQKDAQKHIEQQGSAVQANLQQREAALSKKEAELAALTQTITADKSALDQRDRQATNRENSVREREKIILTREIEIAEREKNVAQRERTAKA